MTLDPPLTRTAIDPLVAAAYDELRRIARRELSRHPSDTLMTAGLVHELYLKLSRSPAANWRDRDHFLRAAAIAMRNLLVDRARRRTAEKRGGLAGALALADATADATAAVYDQGAALLDLHDAIDALARLDRRLADVVECRFFGGMSEEETARVLDVTERTVRRDWVKARALLRQMLDGVDCADETRPPQWRAAS